MLPRHYQLIPRCQLERMAATDPCPPVFEPTPETSRHLTCIICYDFKPGAMVQHFDCTKLFCSTCANKLVEGKTESKCPLCHDPLIERNPLGTTRFHRPPPALQNFMDDVEYHCNICDTKVTYSASLDHLFNCQGTAEERRPRFDSTITNEFRRSSVVSNPEPEWLAQVSNNETSSRWFVIHLNGKKFWTTSVKNGRPIGELKERIARRANLNLHDLYSVKFSHRIVDDSELVENVSLIDGFTHLNFYSALPKEKARTHLIDLYLLGPSDPPKLPKRLQPTDHPAPSTSVDASRRAPLSNQAQDENLAFDEWGRPLEPPRQQQQRNNQWHRPQPYPPRRNSYHLSQQHKFTRRQ